LTPAGFYTEEIREKGVRRGYRLESIEGRQGVLAHVDFRGGPRVGRYGVDVAGFEAFPAGPDLSAPLLLIDEISKMECLSPHFVALVRERLGSDRTVVATVALRESGFITEVKQPRGCRLVERRPGGAILTILRRDLVRCLGDR
jgi:nucleoside-triphosphatase